jgi:hypothetical protein
MPFDLASLTTRVNQSRLLTEAERTYWRGNLPRMNEEQLGKLDAILTEAEQLAWNPAMQGVLDMATRTASPLPA